MKNYYARDVELHLDRCDSVTLSREEWCAIRKELEGISKTPDNSESTKSICVDCKQDKEVWCPLKELVDYMELTVHRCYQHK